MADADDVVDIGQCPVHAVRFDRDGKSVDLDGAAVQQLTSGVAGPIGIHVLPDAEHILDVGIGIRRAIRLGDGANDHIAGVLRQGIRVAASSRVDLLVDAGDRLVGTGNIGGGGGGGRNRPRMGVDLDHAGVGVDAVIQVADDRSRVVAPGGVDVMVDADSAGFSGRRQEGAGFGIGINQDLAVVDDLAVEQGVFGDRDAKGVGMRVVAAGVLG